MSTEPNPAQIRTVNVIEFLVHNSGSERRLDLVVQNALAGRNLDDHECKRLRESHVEALVSQLSASSLYHNLLQAFEPGFGGSRNYRRFVAHMNLRTGGVVTIFAIGTEPQQTAPSLPVTTLPYPSDQQLYLATGTD